MSEIKLTPRQCAYVISTPEAMDQSTEYFGDGEFFIQDLDDGSCLIGCTEHEMDVNGLDREDALKHYIVQQRRRMKDLIEIAREHEINLSYTNAVLEQAQDIVITLCKDSEKLSKARAVLREYEELIENIKKGAWLTQEAFINATSALHKLADALESEAECVVLEPLAPSYCLPESEAE